jgi:hypothetical protein
MSGQLLTASDCGKRITVTADSIDPRFGDFAVLTPNKEICSQIERCKKRDTSINKRVYKEVLINVLKYSNEELTELWKSQSQAWTDWCNDVVIFYAVRLVLFNRPIPICENMCEGCSLPESKTKLRKCSICEIAYYCSTECQNQRWKEHKKTCSPCR